MKRATRLLASTFGVIVGLVGGEHAVGAILQGNTRLDSIVFASWPDAEAYRVLAGEPAMTLVPNTLVTGILALLVSLVTAVWAVFFVHRRHGGLVLILLSVLLLLVGGGFGPPVVGIITGSAALGLAAPAKGGPARSSGLPRFLAALWPYVLFVAVAGYLSLFPGLVLYAHATGVSDSAAPVYLTPFSFGALILAIVSARARDRLTQARSTAA